MVINGGKLASREPPKKLCVLLKGYGQHRGCEPLNQRVCSRSITFLLIYFISRRNKMDHKQQHKHKTTVLSFITILIIHSLCYYSFSFLQAKAPPGRSAQSNWSTFTMALIFYNKITTLQVVYYFGLTLYILQLIIYTVAFSPSLVVIYYHGLYIY